MCQMSSTSLFKYYLQRNKMSIEKYKQKKKKKKENNKKDL